MSDEKFVPVEGLEVTATYEIKIDADANSGRWRATFRDVSDVASDPYLAVAGVLEELALRMRCGGKP